MNHEKRMNKFFEKKRRQLGMGGENKCAARKLGGKLNARERIEQLVDAGSFQEIGLFTHSIFPEMAEATPTDGKIVGLGLVHRKPVGVISNDMTVLGASSSVVNSKKIQYMTELSTGKGIPLVFLAESSGGRIPDNMGSRGMAMSGQNPYQYRRLRRSPWVSALLGPCYGSSSWYSCLSDVSVMLKGATLAVSSPKVTSIAIGETVHSEDLGGWKVHSRLTGLVDAAADRETECIDFVKRILSYLPTNSLEVPTQAEVSEESGRNMSDILDLLPSQRNRTYDMKSIIATIVDAGDFLELKAEFGLPCVTAFARIGGYSVGIIANNPLYGAGAINVDCCDKITNFIVTCDSYNIPLVMLVDTPGFLIGRAGEEKKVTGKIMNWMNALSLVTVPKLTVIIRKVYGQAYLNMGGGKHSDILVAWPTAEISFVDPGIAVNIVYDSKKEDDSDNFEELLDQVSRQSEPWDAAGIFGITDIIDPKDTRNFLIKMIDLHAKGVTKGISEHLMSSWPTSF
jgi:acetyl-CoA carboxylase carboxyltransferase component